MILDLIFIAGLILMAVKGKKKGIVNIVMGLVSGILALFLVFTFQADIKEAVSKTQIYEKTRVVITEKIDEAIVKGTEDNILLRPFLEESGVSGVAAEKIMSTFSLVLTFILAFALLRIVCFILNGIFHFPVLRLFNGVLGMVWNGALVILVTYAVLAVAGQITVAGESKFFLSQMESSVVVKNMYENNLLINMFD